MAKEGIKKTARLDEVHRRLHGNGSKYVERIATAKEKGKWVATHGTQQPLEILEAMDVVGLFNEFWGVISDVVKLESVPEALSISASTGTPGEVCSFFRNMDGLMHAGKWPHTDFLLYATSSATTSRPSTRWAGATASPVSAWSGPTTRTRPMRWSTGRTSTSGLIAFLEEQTGKKMDYDRLKETVRLSYRLTELHLEIDKLVAHVPCPLSAECFGGTLLAIRLLPGTQEAVDFLTDLRDELQERVDKGIGAVKDERFRVMWSAFTPFFDPTLHALHAAEVRSGHRVRGAFALARGVPNGCSIRTIRWATSPTGPCWRPATANTRPASMWPRTSSTRPASSRRMGRSSTTTGAARPAAASGPIVKDELLRAGQWRADAHAPL